MCRVPPLLSQVEDFARGAIKKNVEAIKEAEKRTPLPAPQLPPDTFMMQFSKDAAAQASVATLKDSPPPAHAFDLTESYTYAATPAKPESGAIDRSAYEGVRPSVGSDSYMSAFAKTVSSFTPSRTRSKETQKVPPQEVTI